MATAEDLLTRNLVLAGLPAGDREAVAAASERVELETRQAIYEVGRPIDLVFFPVDAVVSLLAVMQDDRSVEIGTVGREGFAGIPLFLQGGFTSEHSAFAQVPGTAIALSAPHFERLIAELPALRTMLHRYTLALLAQIAQASACNRLHDLEQRCARWLLMTHDRVDRDEFPLTQEFLAQMLGTRRAGVNEAQQALSSTGLISYVRGVIRILDRRALEERSCECYALIRAEHDRLGGVDPTAVA